MRERPTRRPRQAATRPDGARCQCSSTATWSPCGSARIRPTCTSCSMADQGGRSTRRATSSASSLADWYVDRDAGLIEVRLAWGLLNVTDPSSRRVLRRIAPLDRFETTVSAGFRFAVAAVARNDGAVRAWLPARTTYAWAPWEEPVWHERLKPAYAALRDVWGSW